MASKISMPISSGGIMRYFSDYKSKISLKPGYVVYFAIIMIFVVVSQYIGEEIVICGRLRVLEK